MFDDFTPSPEAKKSRRRLHRSIVAASVIYIGGGSMLVAATAGANRYVEVEVETIKGPPPEAPPAPTVDQPAPIEKPQAKSPPPRRKAIVAPKVISNEKLAESNAALTSAGDTGPGDAPAPEPPPPPPPPPPAAAPPPPPPAPEPLVPPVEIDTRRPKYPERARDLEIEGVVVVEFDILPDGSVSNIHIISGPAEFYDSVTKTVATWRYKPARRGQLAVSFHKKQPIRFNFSD
jgi:periplasmic protein TonB